MKTKARTVTRTARPQRSVVPVRRPQPSLARAVLIQPSLTVGAVNDPAEREAETMAARVVGATAPTQTSPPVAAAGGAGPATAAPLRRDATSQPNLDELTPDPAPAEHQDFELPTENDVAADGLEATDMDELESGEPMAAGGSAEGAVQASAAPQAAVGRMGGRAPADVSRLVANPGPGRPLPNGVRQRIEPHFGTSFEHVRLHDGPADQDAAARIGARAFAHRNRIWLGRGESPTNTRLMAHELTHVVQQTEGADRLPINRRQGQDGVVQREPIRREEEEGWLSGKLEGYARHVPGYTLITVLVGKRLISGKKVPMTASNLLEGLFGLIPLGTVLFDKLKEAKVVEDAFAWTKLRLSQLNITWSRVSGLIDKIWDAPWSGTIKYIIGLFAPLVRDIITFATDVGKKVLELIVQGALKLAGPWAAKVWGVLQGAGQVLGLIVKDPLGFAMNLVRAVVGGFKQFGTNILAHLKKGLLGWLFGAVAKAGITMPEKLDFKGLMSLAMQLLGITYANFRKELVKKLGPSGERKVAMIEASVEIVRVLLKEGFAGIWQKMLEMIENFKSTLIGGLISMVTTSIVKAGIGLLAGLSNPIGAVVKVVLSIYNLIVAFVERLDQIMAVAQSIFSSIGAIARGQVSSAANFIEETIGRTVPVVISFLAAAFGITGISTKIREIIARLQAPVKKAMGKMIGFVIKKAKALFSKLIGKLNGKRKLPSKAFKIGRTPHTLYGKYVGKKVEVYMASEDGPLSGKGPATNAETADNKEKSATEASNTLEKSSNESASETGEVTSGIDPQSQKQNNQTKYATLHAELIEAAEEFERLGLDIEKNPFLDTSGKGQSLLRNKEPRSEFFEGTVDTYSKLTAAASKNDPKDGYRLSRFYELDHTIEKRFPLGVFEQLHVLNDLSGTPQLDSEFLRASRQKKANKTGINALPGTSLEASVQKEAAPVLGLLNSKATGDKIGPDAGGFPAMAVYHRNHIQGKGKNLPDASTIIKAALSKKTVDERVSDVKSAIKAQLNAEAEDIKAIYQADPSASDLVKTNVIKGIEALKAQNMALYGLDRVQPKRTPHTLATAKANNGSDILFEGGQANGNDLIKIEGIGMKYGARSSKIGDFIEYDHILDKAFVHAAKSHKIIDAHEKLPVKLASDKNATSKLQARLDRLAELEATPLFSDKPKVLGYADDDGFAVPIYRPLATEVTSAVKQPVDTVRAPVKTADYQSDAAEYVRSGIPAARLSFVAKKRAAIQRVLESRTANHASAVREVYLPEVAKVKTINSDPAGAERKMKIVLKNLYVSLRKAESETVKLFQ
ncbi:eCIS core domain-containing protein [Litoreibacter janthinus]|uniref:eCIS core domain-containing protein n=1 Tax=Litoreibacter janthinus TaxID=670154 RepID=A0A1I6H8L8_9RHOB|nr:DUF4157 domain-containing protein [Litoreibacter janthinus]SFR50792.1 protein of unknown function [Litoreibacter janthinus]